MAIPSGVWVFNNATDPTGILGTFHKHAADVLTFRFDLGNVAEIVGGESVVSAVLNASGVSIGTPSVGPYTVDAVYSGGSSSTVAQVVCTVTTTLGAIISRTGLLVIQ